MKGKKTIAIVVVVVLVAAGVVLLLAQTLLGPAEVVIRAREFRFDVVRGSTTFRVGETVRIVFINEGVLPHEILPVADAERANSLAKELVQEYIAKGMDEEEIEEVFDEEKEGVLEHLLAWRLLSGVEDAEPGETSVLEARFERPGEYYFVCTEIDGTFPDTHVDRGMTLRFRVLG